MENPSEDSMKEVFKKSPDWTLYLDCINESNLEKMKKIKGTGPDKDLYAITFRINGLKEPIDELFFHHSIPEAASLAILNHLQEREWKIVNVTIIIESEEPIEMEEKEPDKDYFIIDGKLYSTSHESRFSAYEKAFDKLTEGYLLTVEPITPQEQELKV